MLSCEAVAFPFPTEMRATCSIFNGVVIRFCIRADPIRRWRVQTFLSEPGVALSFNDSSVTGRMWEHSLGAAAWPLICPAASMSCNYLADSLSVIWVWGPGENGIRSAALRRTNKTMHLLIVQSMFIFVIDAEGRHKTALAWRVLHSP